MKLVYSHWSAPRFMSMDLRIIFALSVHLAAKNYSRIELVTDTPGAKLIDRLQLPFTTVRTDLDGLDVPLLAWASGKLKAYSVQTEPFLHVDQDVFLHHRLPEEVEKAGLVAQSFEERDLYAAAIYNTPAEHVGAMTLGSDMWQAYNAGILGGNDVEFLREYSTTALDAIRANPSFHPVSMTVYEQAFFGRLARDRGKKVTTLLEDEEDAEAVGYTHLMGAKQRPECVARVRRRLQMEDPALFQRAVLAHSGTGR